MPWLKVDDALAGHPKLTRYESKIELCLGTITLMWLYCAQNLTDGVIPARQEPLYDPAVVELLLLPFDGSSGFLERDHEGRLVCHDYLDYNPSRAEVLADREAARLRKERSRNKSRRDVQRDERSDATRTDGVRHTHPEPVPEETDAKSASVSARAPKCFNDTDAVFVAGRVRKKFADASDEECAEVIAALTIGCAKRCSGIHRCWRDYLDAQIRKAKTIKGLVKFVSEDGRAA